MESVKMPFGKFEGTPITELESNYLQLVAQFFKGGFIGVIAEFEYARRTNLDKHFYEKETEKC